MFVLPKHLKIQQSYTGFRIQGQTTTFSSAAHCLWQKPLTRISENKIPIMHLTSFVEFFSALHKNNPAINKSKLLQVTQLGITESS